MLGFRWIRRQILLYHVTRFALKYTDTVRLITRDRSLADAVKEAVHNYAEEAYQLLPRRYNLILKYLFDEELLDAAAYKTYSSNSVMSLIGGDIHEVVTDKATGKVTFIRVPATQFPWQDECTLLERVPHAMRAKIEQLEADVSELRQDERNYSRALVLVTLSS